MTTGSEPRSPPRTRVRKSQDRAADSFAVGDALVESVGETLERVSGCGVVVMSSGPPMPVWALALRVTALSVAPVMAEMISS